MSEQDDRDELLAMKYKSLLSMDHKDLAKLTLASIETIYFTASRCLGLFRSMNVDPEIVQALLEMDDETFNEMWEDAPMVELIKVKLRTSDN